ncbi:group II intron reverse transcriptase/maturase [Salinibacter ruber]|uniref:group II intron reverse transcriptase/maturase n=1 Tax=Salinibacter ruber TaxID=146919 RepID=UPI00216931CE|nr:group II intron reverse transcriptase/maturase [Salinibacter ruber]MCS3632584.1 group II intron reverse transcriptase/maturase [Salinibacter ruber]
MEVEKMQTKLARWSQDQSFEADDIFNIVYDGAFLFEAWLSVEANLGSETAGVDGLTAEDYRKQGLKENLFSLSDRLESGTYEPDPVRRTYIPKGPDEVRPLGIPTIEDRIVQESLRMILEPIYETDFSDDSFGFRPNRSCHDAIKRANSELNPATGRYKRWILDLDIKGYFDNVDHTELMWTLQDRITDPEVLDLIYGTLKAGVKENGQVQVTGKGTPQGGIVSPLLANVYLNELDQWIKGWTEGPKGGLEDWTYVRYADDFMILTNGDKETAEAMKGRVEEFLDEELNLKLSQKKSSIRHAEDGLSFLGYDMIADSTSGACKMFVPQEAKEYIRDRIKEATDGGTDVSVRRKIRSLNSVVRGWANYYKYCTDAAKVFSDVGHLLWHRMTHWLAEKHECSRSQLVQRKLDSKSPIRINEISLFDPNGMSTIRTENPQRHGHPYLSEDGEGNPEPQWKKRYREGHPGPDPCLANEEDRPGSEDQSQWARVRDENTCQSTGCDTSGRKSTVVHHIRHRRSEDDDRIGNLVTLCRRCHRKVHHTDQVVTVQHGGMDEPKELT